MIQQKIDFLEKLSEDFAEWCRKQKEDPEMKRREDELDKSLKAILDMADRPIENIG